MSAYRVVSRRRRIFASRRDAHSQRAYSVARSHPVPELNYTRDAHTLCARYRNDGEAAVHATRASVSRLLELRIMQIVLPFCRRSPRSPRLLNLGAGESRIDGREIDRDKPVNDRAIDRRVYERCPRLRAALCVPWDRALVSFQKHDV